MWTSILVALASFNPVFWEQREFILSEFPYLLFSFAALLAIARAYARLQRNQLELRSALLVSALLYCAYGTRTIGIALVFALIAADLAKFPRPSRFLFGVLALTGSFIAAQTVLLTSPKGYISALHFSMHTVLANLIYYSKTLSYVWQNGFSKEIQIVFALAFTAAAAWGFAKSLLARARREGILFARLRRHPDGLECRDRPARITANLAALFLLRAARVDSILPSIEVTCSSHGCSGARRNRGGELRWRTQV